MAIIHQKDPRCGITYVYESLSYWDKEKKQPRSKRKLIGRLDEKTGEVIPTSGRGRKKKEQETQEKPKSGELERLRELLAEKELRIQSLESEVSRLGRERSNAVKSLKKILEQMEVS